MKEGTVEPLKVKARGTDDTDLHEWVSDPIQTSWEQSHCFAVNITSDQ